MKKRLILSSLLTILMSASIAAGATYALFDSKSETHVEVGSGKVSLVSEVKADTLKLYSMDELQTGKFANGGTATLEGHNVSINGMTPGDRAEFNLAIKNFSTVAAKYRVKVRCESGYDLYGRLNFSCGGVKNWTLLQPDADPSTPKEKTMKVKVELPKTVGNEVQGLTTKLVVAVEAVQGNAETVDELVEETHTTSQITVPVAEIKEQNAEIKSDNGAVKVNFNKDHIEPDAQNVKLDVKNVTEGDKSKFEIETGKEAVYYDIDVTGVNAETEGVEVSVYAGRGLTNVQVLHNKADGSVETLKDVRYDSTTGYVTFKTTSFSAFAITASSVINVPGTGTPNENAVALQKAIDKAGSEAIIKVGKGDFKFDKESNYLKTEDNKNITIIGSGDTTRIHASSYGCAIGWNGQAPLNELRLSNMQFVTTYEKLLEEPDTCPFELTNGHIITSGVSYKVDRLSDVKSFKGTNPVKLDLDNDEYVTMIAPQNAVFATSEGYDFMSKRYLNKKIAMEKEYKLPNDIFVRADILKHEIFSSYRGLRKSIDIDTDYFGNKNPKLNLNGHNISYTYPNKITKNLYEALVADGSDPDAAITMFNLKSNLEISGKGTIDATVENLPTYAIDVYDSNVVINDGNYIGQTSAIQVEKGIVTINGGHFDISNSNKNPADPDEVATFLINCIDGNYTNKSAKVIINGGEFVNFNPAASMGEPKGPVSFLTEDYESVGVDHNGEIWYTVSKKAPVVQG